MSFEIKKSEIVQLQAAKNIPSSDLRAMLEFACINSKHSDICTDPNAVQLKQTLHLIVRWTIFTLIVAGKP